MNKLKKIMKSILKAIVFIFLTCNCAYSQKKIIFTKSISENKIVFFQKQKLIILDFWATWCGPCYAANQQMEIFQERNKDKVFVLSVTDENETLVKKHLIKKPINLMVVLDLDKKYIDLYNVLTRPFAVLLDLDGNLLWKGHPADLNQEILNKFYSSTQKNETIDFEKLITFQEITNQTEINQNNKTPLNINKTNEMTDMFFIDTNKVHFIGKLSSLLAKINKVSVFDIDIQEKLNYQIELNCTLDDWKNNQIIIEKMKSEFKFDINLIEKNEIVSELILENEAFLWDKNQIIWDDSSPKFIDGTDRVKVNDMSIKELAVLLSDLKKKYFIYQGNDTLLHDWDFNYSFDDLMAEELLTSFGLGIKEVEINRTIFKVTSK
jgi:thiol-disulfide isomerase/thioredoxin